MTMAAIGWGQTNGPASGQRQAALVLEQQGREVEAEAAWREVIKMHPANAEAYGHLGLLEARQEHYEEAIPYYRKALNFNPKAPGVRLDLALALFKSGDLKAAVPEFEILRKASPAGSPEAQRYTILLGMSYYGLAEYAKAAPLLQRAADRDASSFPLLLALAHSYIWSKQFNRVLDVYHQILALNPNSAEADMLAGEALDELKDKAAATQMFRDAGKADPHEPNVHFGLGYLLWTQRQYPEAVREFQAELANDPDHVQSMLYMGDAYIQMSQPASAEPLLEKAAQMDPELGLAHLDLGILYSDGGRNDDALRELSIAEKLTPNDVNVHWRLGRFYRTLGRKDEAKAEFDKASSLNKAADEAVYLKLSGSQHATPPGGSVPAPTQPALTHKDQPR